MQGKPIVDLCMCRKREKQKQKRIRKVRKADNKTKPETN